MIKIWNDETARPNVRRRLLSLTALAAMLTVGLITAGAGAANAATSSTARPVPFADAVAGTVTATGATTLALAGSGLATPLGTFRYAGTVTITSPAGATVLTDVLTETLTAANGDSITVHCAETATPIGNTGVLHGVDHWTVTGGTGKYAHATGSGTGDTYVYNLKLFAKAEIGTITTS
jgi:hypothetical protein